MYATHAISTNSLTECLVLFLRKMSRTIFEEKSENVFRRVVNLLYCTLIFFFLTTCTTPQQIIFEGKLSTIIIFKPRKFNVNLWMFVFCVLQKKYPNPLLQCFQVRRSHHLTVGQTTTHTVSYLHLNANSSDSIIINVRVLHKIYHFIVSKTKSLFAG